ncbi:MAG: hypothetical protein AB7F35_01945 [Acetobacteraceae bacterium]
MSSKFAGLALGVDSVARMTIIHPVTRQPLRNAETGEEAWIDLLSAGSSIGRAHDRAVTDRQLRLRGQRYTAEQAEADLIEKLAKLTKAWSLVTLKGEPLAVDCTPAAARELYALSELAWLREQVVEFITDLGNFRPAASTN